MRYRIVITSDAREQLDGLPRKIQEQISRKIDTLADNPRPPQSKRLSGSAYLHRLRSGDYRIVYQVGDEIVTVLVVRIGNRREVYRNLPARVVVHMPGDGGPKSRLPQKRSHSQ